MSGLKWYEIICTWFGLGKSKFMPGTIGSLGAFPIFYFSVMSSYTPYEAKETMLFFIIILSVLGFFAIHKYHQQYRIIDAKQIVIDEVIGQLVTLFIGYEWIGKAVVKLFPKTIITSNSMGVAYIFLCGFITFRFFDIKKPFYISHIDRYWKNAAGVILDDVLAGIYAGLVFWPFK